MYFLNNVCVVCVLLLVEETRDRNFENEIRELRGQLTRSVGAISEMESLRRALEKSERQRAQLSDHIEVKYILLIIAGLLGLICFKKIKCALCAFV